MRQAKVRLTPPRRVGIHRDAKDRGSLEDSRGEGGELELCVTTESLGQVQSSQCIVTRDQSDGVPLWAIRAHSGVL